MEKLDRDFPEGTEKRTDEKTAELKQLKEDLVYVMNFPKGYKYVSILKVGRCRLTRCTGVFANRPVSVYRFPRRALTLCPQLCMGIQPGARFPARSADALPATL